MRGLLQFLAFLWATFAEGKVFTVTGLRQWVDFTTKEPLGWAVDTVISANATDYNAKDGKIISNTIS